MRKNEAKNTPIHVVLPCFRVKILLLFLYSYHVPKRLHYLNLLSKEIKSSKKHLSIFIGPVYRGTHRFANGEHSL